jgi:hypothetical protein
LLKLCSAPLFEYKLGQENPRNGYFSKKWRQKPKKKTPFLIFLEKITDLTFFADSDAAHQFK